jgi:hypothetical protein
MGAVTDAATDTTEQREAADGETGRAPADSNPSESNGVHRPSEVGAGTVTDPTVAETHHDDEPRVVPAAKPAFEFSPAPPHIHRGASGGVFRGASGGMFRGASGGIHRGASGGTGPHRGASGGIYRGRSGGIHLPSLTSLTFSMSRLPEEDAGLQMHLTKTEEVESPAESPRAIGGDGDDDDAPPRRRSKVRKRLTVVGACSFGFRLAETVLSLIAIVVMCSISQSVGVAGADFGTLKFNHFQAYRYSSTKFLNHPIFESFNESCILTMLSISSLCRDVGRDVLRVADDTLPWLCLQELLGFFCKQRLVALP